MFRAIFAHCLFWNWAVTSCLGSSLQPCRTAQVCLLLISEKNRFSGTIPDLASYNLFLLSYLGLRDNILTGGIPEQPCEFTNLHIIDLAQNNLSGAIPKCLGNLEAFTYLGIYFSTLPYQHSTYNSCSVRMLSRKVGKMNIRQWFSRGDTESLDEAHRMGTLNLSRNHLTGKIPENIGGLQRLESWFVAQQSFRANSS